MFKRPYFLHQYSRTAALALLIAEYSQKYLGDDVAGGGDVGFDRVGLGSGCMEMICWAGMELVKRRPDGGIEFAEVMPPN